MHDGNLYDLFRQRFPGGDRVFLETPRRTVTYGELDGAVARFAAALAAAGVTPGERVVVQAEKSPEAVLLYLACLRAGAVFVPLNTAYTDAEVGFFLGDAEPRLLVCDPAREAGLAAAAGDAGVGAVLTLDAAGHGTLADVVANAAADAPVAARAGDDLAAILYTSGTTGRSKGAMLSHGNLSSNAEVLHEYWRFVPGDVLLHALPIFHTHGLFVALHCALLNGSTVIFHQRFDAAAVCADLPRATVFMGVPTFYVRLLDLPGFDRAATAHIRLFVSGSAPLLPQTFAAFEERTGMRILERYGMTEAGMITSNPYDGERIAGTVGFALPGVEARVADERGRELPRGQSGVLEIRGPNLFKGYWRLAEKTAEEFRPDGFFITGDVAEMDADGRVSIVGRAKDLVISGGFNVYPKEIEELIDALPGVQESAVIGLPHPDFGEGVTAVVVREGAEPTAEQVAAHLKEGLAAFKRPKQVFFVDDLPRNAMGKVQKNILRDRYADTYQKAAS